MLPLLAILAPVFLSSATTLPEPGLPPLGQVPDCEPGAAPDDLDCFLECIQGRSCDPPAPATTASADTRRERF